MPAEHAREVNENMDPNLNPMLAKSLVEARHESLRRLASPAPAGLDHPRPRQHLRLRLGRSLIQLGLRIGGPATGSLEARRPALVH